MRKFTEKIFAHLGTIEKEYIMSESDLQKKIQPIRMKREPKESDENQTNAILRQNDRIIRILDAIKEINDRVKKLEARIFEKARRA